MNRQSLLFFVLGTMLGMLLCFFFIKPSPPAIPTTEPDAKPINTSHPQSLSDVPISRSNTSSGIKKPKNSNLILSPDLLLEFQNAPHQALDHRQVLLSDGDLIAKALEINLEEQQQLEQLWATLRPRILNLQKKNLHFQEKEDAITIETKPFPATKEYDEFVQGVTSALGAKRAEAFLKLTRTDEAFGRWGNESSLRCTIQVIDQAHAKPIYRITEHPTTANATERTWMSAEIPDHLRTLTDALGISKLAQ